MCCQGRHPHLCNILTKVSPGLLASQVQNAGLDAHNVTAIKEKINSKLTKMAWPLNVVRDIWGDPRFLKGLSGIFLIEQTWIWTIY